MNNNVGVPTTEQVHLSRIQCRVTNQGRLRCRFESSTRTKNTRPSDQRCLRHAVNAAGCSCEWRLSYLKDVRYEKITVCLVSLRCSTIRFNRRTNKHYSLFRDSGLRGQHSGSSVVKTSCDDYQKKKTGTPLAWNSLLKARVCWHKCVVASPIARNKILLKYISPVAVPPSSIIPYTLPPIGAHFPPG